MIEISNDDSLQEQINQNTASISNITQCVPLIQAPNFTENHAFDEQQISPVVGGMMIGSGCVSDLSARKRGKDKQQRRRRCKNCLKFSTLGIGREHTCRGRNSRGNNTCQFYDQNGNEIC